MIGRRWFTAVLRSLFAMPWAARASIPRREAHHIFRVPIWASRHHEMETAQAGDAAALLTLPAFAEARRRLSDHADLQCVCGVSERDGYIWLRATGWIAA